MNENQPFKYQKTLESSNFARTLNDRVNTYFTDRGISRHANAHMIFKSVLFISLWIGTYVLILTDWFSPLGVIAMFVVHGFAQLLMTYNISHDANHKAYSSNPLVNKVLACSFDLVGINSYIWRLLHNTSHHSFVNVQGKDSAITSNKILRFAPDEIWTPLHRYQHIYAPLIYTLPTLEWVLTKDFYYFFFHRDYGNQRIEKHPRKELIFLLATKLFYFGHILVIPIIFLSVPWYVIIIGFLLMHAFIGFHIALIFQPCHINEQSEYPNADKDGYLPNDIINHVFATTSDFSRKRPLTTWMFGGLNLHSIHHMYSTVCHIHYPALTEILRETASEFGYKYREYETVGDAFRAHLSMLKELGQPPVLKTVDG
ncbi:MAG: fatty acid desaturase family protein [Saprospiraceae bacterium]